LSISVGVKRPGNPLLKSNPNNHSLSVFTHYMAIQEDELYTLIEQHEYYLLLSRDLSLPLFLLTLYGLPLIVLREEE
jgi:hypothetical protein